MLLMQPSVKSVVEIRCQCVFHRVLKLARTIADLAGAENIGTSHLAGAIQYRPRGMGNWDNGFLYTDCSD